MRVAWILNWLLKEGTIISLIIHESGMDLESVVERRNNYLFNYL